MIRRDARSKLSTGTRRPASGFTHAFVAPSLTYRALPMLPAAFAALHGLRRKRNQPLEKVREQLRVSVWEAEGGSLPEGVAEPVNPGLGTIPPIRR